MPPGINLKFDDAGNGKIDRSGLPECMERLPCRYLEVKDLMHFCHYTDPPLLVLEYFEDRHGRQCPLGKWWLSGKPVRSKSESFRYGMKTMKSTIHLL